MVPEGGMVEGVVPEGGMVEGVVPEGGWWREKFPWDGDKKGFAVFLSLEVLTTTKSQFPSHLYNKNYRQSKCTVENTMCVSI